MSKDKRDKEDKYRQELVSPEGKKNFFAELAKIQNEDSKQVQKMKKKIQKLVR